MSTYSLMGLTARDLATASVYAERVDDSLRPESAWDAAALSLWHGMVRPFTHAAGRLRQAWTRRRDMGDPRARRVAQAALRQEDEAKALSDTDLRARGQQLGVQMRRQGFAVEPVAECFALVREAARRVLGKAHYPVQLQAGWLLLQGHLVEMATGEGKTLVATLPAVTAALANVPVHVITVNDYLAERDASTLRPLYEFFGLPVAHVAQGMPREARRQAYAGPVVYASNKELAFDYLRDRAAQAGLGGSLRQSLRALTNESTGGGAVMRGLVFGIVDEADSVFIDEARTPLILSGSQGERMDAEHCRLALALAAELSPTNDFLCDLAHRRVQFTEAGREQLARRLALPAEPAAAGSSGRSLAELLGHARAAEESVLSALHALHLFVRDRDYVLRDGKVQIVDESTGRVMPDRSWEQGLHQMVEAKEGLSLTPLSQTVARITYQRLFRRYLRLAGMSGTVAEMASEIGQVYELPIRHIPLNKAARRRQLAPQCLPDQASKWAAVAAAVRRVAVDKGRPVLVGTRSVRASETLSALLQAQGVQHAVLNARQDSDEATIIAQAGRAGRVTVATNMAGRGTDILLSERVVRHGGLHVILTEYNESARVDRQLLGRCARQGDRGSAQAIVALDDDLFTTHAPRLAGWLRWLAASRGKSTGTWALALMRASAQRQAERKAREQRKASVRQDRQLARLLAFSGSGE